MPVIVPISEQATTPAAIPKISWPRKHSLCNIWGRVRWKMAAIVIFTGASTILVTCLAVATVNVMVRRESSNVVEKQIQVLVQASRSVAPAILDHSGACVSPPASSRGLKPVLAYTDEAFPQAQTFLTVEKASRVQSLLPGSDTIAITRPGWAAGTGFDGLVVDHGQLEIRNVIARQDGSCKATVVFSMPLGSELAKRLSSAGKIDVASVSPRPFRVHSPSQRILRTIEGNFILGISRPTAVVLTVRNWETGALEDWVAYSVRPSYSSTFEDVAHSGSQLANWVWLLAAFALTVLLLETAGAWMCIRFGSDIATTVDDLSSAARQIAGGNFTWRTPVRSKGQLGDLTCNFNEMAIALEEFQKEEAARLTYESELQVARSVQEYLYPRVAPVLPGVTVSGQTSAARMIGGDLYDFFDLGRKRIGILCADASGKGIPAALMMANLQAVARALAGNGMDGTAVPPAQFVEMLNHQLTGRFGDNRYASLFWAEYDTQTAVLSYVNAGHPLPILTHSNGEIERLDSGGVPIGMFAKARYTAGKLRMQPGHRLIIFTDGLSDAENAAEEEFGDERLIACCSTIATGIDAQGVADRVMQAAAEWSAGTEQFDDTTIVVMAVAP